MDGSEVGPFNLGNPTEFTMLQLAELVKEVVNPKAEIVYKDNTPDDPSRRKPDISKVGVLLVFEGLTRSCM
jgi:UDP-glucuronate decarboxylase